MHPTKFQFIWSSCFREDFLEINQSETRIACGGISVVMVIMRTPTDVAWEQILPR
jgi:hypothetical protein